MVPGGALTLVVLLEQVVAQVVAVVAPDGVDVVAVVDLAVELDEELRALDPVAVRLAALGGAGPAERQPGLALSAAAARRRSPQRASARGP